MILIPKVREWLESQDFPLEMRAANAFRSAGFEVRQSKFYVDPETGKSREIDVEATDPDFRGIVNIRFIVECKGGKRPWVLLCSADTIRNYNRFFAFVVSNKLARHTLIDHANSVQELKALFTRIPWLDKDGLVGYSLRQAHSDKDTAYEAAISVAKACKTFLRESDDKNRLEVLEFAFPVIVVEGPLIRCWLAEDGDLQFEETNAGEFLFASDFGACIRVITADHLLVFAREAKDVAEKLRSELKSDEERILESWKSNK